MRTKTVVPLLAASLGALAIVAAYVYDRTQPLTTVVEPDHIRGTEWRGTYTVENKSHVDAWVTFAGSRCEDGLRVRGGAYWTADIREGFCVTLCAPGAVARIEDTIDGRAMSPVTVPAARLVSRVSGDTLITLRDPRPYER